MCPINEDVSRISKDFAGNLLNSGAKAVLLTGSWARDDATAESDVDLLAIGSGPDYRLYRVDHYLVSISHITVEDVRTAFGSPGEAGWVIPGWCTAKILLDPADIAAQLIEEAQSWTWDVVGDEICDSWVAEEITGYAEEVHKLIYLSRDHRRTGAAIQRYLLAARMARIAAVHRRLLYQSENTLWDLVAEEMGSTWTTAQHRAFGIHDETFEDTIAASLQLYFLTAQAIRHLLTDRQFDVVRHACALAGHTLD